MRFNPLLAAVLGLCIIAAVPVLVKHGHDRGTARSEAQPQYHVFHSSPSGLVVSGSGNDESRTDLAESSEPEKPENGDNGSSSLTNWMQALSAAAIVALTLALVRLESRQTGLMRSALIETASATKQMKRANRIARAVAVADTRPILIFESLRLTPYAVTGQMALPLWKNIGRGAAKVLRVELGREIRPAGVEVDFASMLDEFEARQTATYGEIFAPNESRPCGPEIAIKAHPRMYLEDFAEGSVGLFVPARITYTNAVNLGDKPFITAVVVQIMWRSKSESQLVEFGSLPGDDLIEFVPRGTLPAHASKMT